MPLDPTDQKRHFHAQKAYSLGFKPNANQPAKKASSKQTVDMKETRPKVVTPSTVIPFSQQDRGQVSGSIKGLEVEHQEGSHACPAPVQDEPHTVPPSPSDNPYAFDPGISEHVKEADGTYGSSDIDNAKSDAKALALKKEVREICDDFYRAIDGLGTDDKLFEKTLSRLNADNIIEVMSNWEQTYGEDYKEHFIDSFLGDADPSQKKEFGLKIVQALEERADKLGYDEYYTKTATKAKISLNESPLDAVVNKRSSFYINTLYNILKFKEK